jgi:tetratricopeptide (TPR) repeat protein
LSQDSLLTLGEQAARRAIALAPTLGEAYASLGEILEGRLRWSEATAQFEQAVRLAPRYPTGHQWYAYNLQAHARWDEAVREMEIAHQLDPLSHVITLSLANLYDGADRFAEATPLLAQGLAQSPEAAYAWMGRVGHELAIGHVDSAAASFRRVQRFQGIDSATAARTERGLVDPATRDATVDALIRGEDLSAHQAAIAFARWTRDEAAVYRVLERMAGQGTGSTPILTVYSMLGPKLRADPRVQALVARIGAPPPGPPRPAP